MYIDLIILIIAIILVLTFMRRFSSFVLFVAIFDMFLRILSFIKYHIGLDDIAAVIGKYLPESVLHIIDKYTGSVPFLCALLEWGYVFIMCVFLVYTFRWFIYKKKI